MKIVRVFLFILAGCWFCAAIAVVVGQFRTVYPSPENKSAFLKTYTPDTVLDQFKDHAGFYEEAWQASDGAETGFASHMVAYKPIMAIKFSDWAAVMQAVREDITFRLAAQRAEIVEEPGNNADEFKIAYTLGKSKGEVAVDSIKSVDPFVQRGMAPGEVAIQIRIQIHEKWYKAHNQGARNRAS